MRKTMLAAALTLGFMSMPLQAQQAAPPADGIRTEATVVVEGEQPGPGLWLVRKGSHDLYVLGTLRPLPMKMQWQSAQLQQVLAQAQEVIRMRGVQIDADVGFFRGLLLMPKLLGARNNPDDRKLQQVVSPASYARWQTLKARYIGSDGGVEKRRPLFAAQELYSAAMKKSGLDTHDLAWPVVAEAIETHSPTVTVVKETIVIKDPKPLLKEWSKTTLDDLACFDSTMTHIETDLDAMRARANAWATGDVAALRALPPAYRWEACSNAITEAGIGKRLGYGDAQRKLRAKWLAAAEAALERNTVSFATLALSDMLGTDGYLAALQAKGYTVIAPDE
ncbi:TraB/GumN family protein [Thermomonas sp.]|jgi:hypothetical protein|uniref:TraB/GumN family protein n=1 Tax=Thermomonas sp. TaxID=1971895 RepID=UPI002580B81D|nr:TraB/GumN family protein [Thermomonas sp.]